MAHSPTAETPDAPRLRRDGQRDGGDGLSLVRSITPRHR